MAKPSKGQAEAALMAWLANVLEIQCSDGVVELPNGDEAAIRFDAARKTISVYAFGDEEQVLATVRIAPEK